LLKTAETKQSDAAAELEAYLKKTAGNASPRRYASKLGISEEYAAMTPDQKKPSTPRCGPAQAEDG
jgi:hypothetical protein